MKLDDVLRNASDLLDFANEVRDEYREGVRFANHVDDAIDYYNSEEREMDLQIIESYDRKNNISAILFIILWILIIVATIVLCVTGNDVILKLLHI